ncbi:kinase-like protein [Parathielavia hyrcaniae]|uniref:Kinase-like protein n=1 Tax=Parathielavia hyrcaniae TaxID=113614 RepID=A0AAN6PWN4_9PEZI|nr:kinase-like protein [Parathielavia hyrcaniae]
MGRVCADDERDLPQTSYTANQWSKGQGNSIYAGCVHGHYSDSAAAQPYDNGRYNDSTRASVEDHDIAHSFASAVRARFVLWFKTGAVFDDDYFNLDIRAVDKALGIVNRFNQLAVVDKVVKFNVPDVWTFARRSSSCSWDGKKALCEPFIQNYQKFNSNSGWNDDSMAWAKVMQALSHFSYHVSGGNHVLCDLQGDIYQREIVLSGPVILSRTREYGGTDLGPEGISSFSSQHRCNNYCRSHWTKPFNPRQYYDPVPGTTMISRTMSTAASRPAYTGFYC